MRRIIDRVLDDAGDTELLEKLLSLPKRLLKEEYGARLSVMLRKRSGYPDGEGFFGRMVELVRSELPEVPLSFDSEHEDNNYYKGLNFKLYMEKENETVEIGDGGFVDWVAKMTGNKKARCLISGLGMDRISIMIWNDIRNMVSTGDL